MLRFPRLKGFDALEIKRIEMDAVMNAPVILFTVVYTCTRIHGRRGIFSSTFPTFSPRSHNANVIPRLSSSLLAVRRIFDIRETKELKFRLPRREFYLKGNEDLIKENANIRGSFDNRLDKFRSTFFKYLSN